MTLIGGIFGDPRVVPGLSGGPLPDDAILHIKTKNYPDFLFEWHPRKQNVYICRILRDDHRNQLPRQSAEVIAFNIENHGQAQNAVLIWLRGYQTATNDRAPVPFLKAQDY